LHSAHIFHAEVVVKATQFACAPFIIKNLIGRIVVEILFKPELKINLFELSLINFDLLHVTL